jgi:hypothetical protein
LQEAEAAYRFILIREPDNMDVRVNLAWCLLLQALYQSGKETVIAERGDAKQAGDDPNTDITPGPDAGHLLQECLRHSMTVKHLSARASNQMDMEKLEALVRLAGGKDLLVSSEENGARIIDNIVNAIWQASEQDNPEAF